MPKKPGRGAVLSDRQRQFVDEYLVDLNIEAAALRAGYRATYARAMAHRQLFALPAVQSAIKSAMDRRAERVEITQDDVLREILVILKSDVRNFHVDDVGTLTLREGVDDAAWRAVSSVKHKIRTFTDDDGNTETTREIEFRLWDKTAATKQAGEHLGMYLKKLEHKFPEGGGVLAVPMPVDPAQWVEIVRTQQKALTSGTKDE